MSDTTHGDSTGPIKTGKQFFWVSVASFVVPFFTIVALVSWINAGDREAVGSTDTTAKIEARIQPVARVVVEGDEDADATDASQEPAPAAPADAAPVASAADAGKALYESTCAACHAAGVAGAPKYGDKDAWAPLIDSGMDAMMNIAINGKGAMPPRGGSQASDEEVHAAVLYMVSAADPDAAKALGGDAGTKDAGAAGDDGAKDDAAADDDAKDDAAAKDAQEDAGAVAAAGGVDLDAGKKLYDTSCFACHGAGVAGAPKFGDKDAWAPLVASGMDAMMNIAINGKGAMPPRGATTASDEELRDAVLYMVNQVDPDFVSAQ